MNPAAPLPSIPWEAWTALGTLGGLMLTLCILLGRAIWKMSEFVGEVRRDRVLTSTRVSTLDRRVNHLHHKATAMTIAGIQTATLLAYPSGESKAEKVRNVEDWKRILDNTGDTT